LYPYGLGVSAYDAAARGDVASVESACELALAATDRLRSDPEDWRVEQLVDAARAAAAIATGDWEASAVHNEHAAEIGRAVGRRTVLANALMGAATGRVMAGDPDAAAPLASEGLEVARAAGTPIQIVMSLVALAGALVEREPERTRALLDESLKLRDALGFEGSSTAAQTTLIAARTRDWALTLQFAERAIRYLHWGGERAYLSVSSTSSPGRSPRATLAAPPCSRAQPAGWQRRRCNPLAHQHELERTRARDPGPPHS
jgi:hypothetical protein